MRLRFEVVLVQCFCGADASRDDEIRFAPLSCIV